MKNTQDDQIPRPRKPVSAEEHIKTRLEREDISLLNKIGIVSHGAGFVFQTAGIFVLANSIVPDQYRSWANIGVTIYAAGQLCRGFGYACYEVVRGYQIQDIQDRLKAYPNKD